MSNTISRWKLYTLMGGLVVVGAFGASLARLQGKQKVGDGNWEHPWFQAFAMFIGESFCLGYYFIEKQINRRKFGTRGMDPDIIDARKEGLRSDINVFLFAIPAACDCIATALIYVAYLNIPISVAEMMGGALILITTISSVVLLNKRFFLYQWLSLIGIIAGVVMVGASSLENKKDPNENPALGIILMLIAMCIQACQMIVEEKLFRKYKLSPLKVIGFEGVFGMCFYIVFLFVAYFIHCNGALCHNGRLEDSIAAINGLGENIVLLFLVIALILDIGIFNTLGVSVTKYASCSNRATVNTCKVVLVWGFFLAYPGDGGESFHWLQLGGFIIIVFGTFIFNAERSPKQLEIEETGSLLSKQQREGNLNFTPLDTRDSTGEIRI